MDGLIAFWRNRLDEREKTAQLAGGGEWRTECECEGLCEDYPSCSVVVGVKSNDITIYAEGGHDANQADHIAANDPKAVLADIAADRALIDLYQGQAGRDLPEGVHDGRDPDEQERDEDVKEALGEAVKIRAARFSSHSGWREEWER